MSDDARRLRERYRQEEDRIGREAGRSASDVQTRRLAVVFDEGNIPTEPGRFMWVRWVDVSGEMVEGGEGELQEVPIEVLAICLGPDVPEAGDVVEVVFVYWRWVFKFWRAGNP